MASRDPFAQLERYIKSHKPAPKQLTTQLRQSRPPQQTVAKQNAQVAKEFLVSNAIELRAPLHRIECPVHKNDENESKRVRKSSPFANATPRNPIVADPPSADFKDRDSEAAFRSGKRRCGTPTRSQKSYDFVGETAEDDDLQRVFNRKLRLVKDYKANSAYWNRDTGKVFETLVSDLNPLQQEQAARAQPPQEYEDPKLARMKNIMKYHKERLERKDSNAVLKGVAGEAQMTAKSDSRDKQLRQVQNQSDIFFVKPAPETPVAQPQTRETRGRSASATNVFPTPGDSVPVPTVRKMSPLKYKYDVASNVGLAAKRSEEEEEGQTAGVRGKRHFQDGSASTQSSFFRDYFQPKSQTSDGGGGALKPAGPSQRASLIEEYKRRLNKLE